MGIHIKNNTNENIYIQDLGITLEVNDSYDLLNRFPDKSYRRSGDIILLIANGDILVNDETVDITDKSEALLYFLGKEITLAGAKSIDGRISIQTTPRPVGTMTYFTGIGDDPSDPSLIGNGQLIELDFKTGISTYPIPKLYIDFNTIENKTSIHDAIVSFQNTNFDRVSVHIVPKVTTCTTGENTNFNIYGGYLVLPAAGNGTTAINSQDIKLVESPLKNGVRGTAYWNADYNTSTKTFDNLSPAPLGDGVFNIFSAEIEFVEFVCNWSMLGSAYAIKLITYDSEPLGHNMRLRFTFNSSGDHDFKFATCIHMFREKTC